MSLHVGIDFGTSNSGVALYDGQQVKLLPLDPDNVIPQVLKTILYVTRDGQHYIGQEAIELYYRQNVGRQRRFVRQWTGEIEYRGADMFYVRDIFTEVDELAPGRLVQLIKTALRTERYQGTQIFEQYYTVADLIAAYLGALKRRAEAYLGCTISQATIGRPVHFSPNPEIDQRAQDILQQAAQQAGFQQVNFELEPVAAALDYELQLKKPEKVLIFDFGGGTLDLTILRLGDPQQRQIFASGGIGIAGSDFDRAIIQSRLLPHFGHGLTRLPPEVAELVAAVADWTALPDLSTPLARGHLARAIRAKLVPVRLRALQALIFNDLAFTFYNAVEAAKIALSRQGATVIRLQEKDLNLWELYTRWQFEQDIAAQQEQIEAVLLETVARSGLEPHQIDAVVTTGGSSNIPVFREMLGRHFGAERVKAANAFTSVTAGLAVRAYQNERGISF